MSESLEAIYDGHQVGTLSYAKDRLAFAYNRRWLENPNAFPISLSMPLLQTEYADSLVRAFISGLLPDDPEVLMRWGRRFQVSPQNPFRLLAHVGEECAGAIQFVRPESLPDWLGESPPRGIDWLSEAELEERIRGLIADHSQARRHGDEGHFSLPGAQAKTGLYFDQETGRWGIPRGGTPTTHILKPNTGEFEDFEINEHFCLRLAARLGLTAANSWTEQIGANRVFVVERYDRARIGNRLVRVHQEDFCQALGVKPENKYQNDGGPSASDIFRLIRDYSGAAERDALIFLRALIYNYLIAGTDGHAKNYSMLIAGSGQFRLAPMYDMISILPYKHQPKKLKLAMKVGGEYLLWKIDRQCWDKAAKQWGFDKDFLFGQIETMTQLLPAAAHEVCEELSPLSGVDSAILLQLATEIPKRAASVVSAAGSR